MFPFVNQGKVKLRSRKGLLFGGLRIAIGEHKSWEHLEMCSTVWGKQGVF